MKRLLLICWINFLLTHLFSQSVNLDSIWINGNIPRQTTLSFIQKSGLKIDSIVKDPTMDSLNADSLIYFGKSSFSYYIKDDICIANTIIFDNKISELILGSYKITKTSTRNDLKRMFPLDCNETKPIKVFGKKEKLERCSIYIKDNHSRLWDMRIIFLFHNDRLARIDFWEPD